MHNRADNSTRGFRGLLGERRWAALAGSGAMRSYRPREFMLQQGEKGGFLLALTSGRVKVLASERDGSEVLLSLRGPGDLVGEMAANRHSHRTATVQALDHCTACFMLRPDFDRFLLEQDAQAEFADYLVAKLSETVPYQIHQVHFSPRQRIARLLLEVVRLADPSHPNRWRVPFSQEGLASALGLARSTVAEQLGVLRSGGVLGPGPRIVVADVRALAGLAGAVTRE
ncbi:Crp/Fnr family transcriptional regulator [Saccharopolyspora shandongensis]|uniref:Crp/Fnr family transcriptional regulator n=1 Tax=Saccharopolyspora shandongensis TaxID=418495 RepID=UPI002481E298|nr:Crp/Fnr family transcriptional regulator [Saccharopolyspora shandongensis]